MTINVELLPTNDIEQLLNQLGGVKLVAHEFNLTTQAVSNWIVRGIPESKVAAMLRLIARTEKETGTRIAWRPLNWDKRFKISYEPAD